MLHAKKVDNGSPLARSGGRSKVPDVRAWFYSHGAWHRRRLSRRAVHETGPDPREGAVAAAEMAERLSTRLTHLEAEVMEKVKVLERERAYRDRVYLPDPNPKLEKSKESGGIKPKMSTATKNEKQEGTSTQSKGQRGRRGKGATKSNEGESSSGGKNSRKTKVPPQVRPRTPPPVEPVKPVRQHCWHKFGEILTCGRCQYSTNIETGASRLTVKGKTRVYHRWPVGNDPNSGPFAGVTDDLVALSFSLCERVGYACATCGRVRAE